MPVIANKCFGMKHSTLFAYVVLYVATMWNVVIYDKHCSVDKRQKHEGEII